MPTEKVSVKRLKVKYQTFLIIDSDQLQSFAGPIQKQFFPGFFSYQYFQLISLLAFSTREQSAWKSIWLHLILPWALQRYQKEQLNLAFFKAKYCPIYFKFNILRGTLFPISYLLLIQSIRLKSDISSLAASFGFYQFLMFNIQAVLQFQFILQQIEIDQMKKIPIWQPKNKQIIFLEHSLMLHQFSNITLTYVYIDHYYEILKVAKQSAESKSDGGREEHQNGDQTVIYDKVNNKTITTQLAISYCFFHNLTGYYLVVIGYSKRLQVIKIGTNLFQFIVKFNNSLSKEEKFSSEKDLDTEISPLQKICPHYYLQNLTLYYAGQSPVHPWQITSEVWTYSIQTGQWKQHTSTLSESFKQEKTVEWVTCIQQAVVYIGKNYIRVKFGKQIDKKSQTIVNLCEEKEKLLFDPQRDSYISCSFNNLVQQGASSTLFLVKSCRQPILFSLTLSNNQIKEKQQDKDKDKKLSLLTNIKLCNPKNGDIYLSFIRYDLGIFLKNSTNLIQEETATQLSVIVNQINFMQVGEFSNHGFTQSLNIPGNSTQNKRMQQASKTSTQKVFILNFYKSGSELILSTESASARIDSYSIKVSLLDNIGVKDQSRPLAYYFQKKQFSDLVFIAEKRQVICNRELFEIYSPKFKKLYSTQSKGQTSQQQTLVKLDQIKLSTIYFLVQHMYNEFTLSLKGFDQDQLFDLMILAHKFQVVELQILCEQEVKFTCQNFCRLYDYFRNSETSRFREEFLKFFVINPQEIMKIMPIGKVEELIRLIYSPQCQHMNFCQVKSKIENKYEVFFSESGESKEYEQTTNFCNILKNKSIKLNICLKCNKIIGFSNNIHNSNSSNTSNCHNKQLVRGNSNGKGGHRKKDNKSN